MPSFYETTLWGIWQRKLGVSCAAWRNTIPEAETGAAAVLAAAALHCHDGHRVLVPRHGPALVHEVPGAGRRGRPGRLFSAHHRRLQPIAPHRGISHHLSHPLCDDGGVVHACLVAGFPAAELHVPRVFHHPLPHDLAYLDVRSGVSVRRQSHRLHLLRHVHRQCLHSGVRQPPALRSERVHHRLHRLCQIRRRGHQCAHQGAGSPRPDLRVRADGPLLRPL